MEQHQDRTGNPHESQADSKNKDAKAEAKRNLSGCVPFHARMDFERRS
jgi:hypothetical protein